MLDYLFFCFRIWPGRNNSSQTMLAAGCFLNFVHYHSAHESRQAQSTTQLSLVQHKERKTLHSPAFAQPPNPTVAPKSCQQRKGADPKVRSQFLSPCSVPLYQWGWRRALNADPTPRRQLQVKLATFPGFDMPRHLFFPKSKADIEEDRAPELCPSPLFLSGAESKAQIPVWPSAYGD